MPEFAGVGRKEVDRLIDWAKQQGMGGLTWMRCTDKGWSPTSSSTSPRRCAESCRTTMGAEVGDLLLFLAGPRMPTLKAGGALRMKLARDNGLLEGKGHQFVWIVDCPLFQADPVTGKLSAFHHPFVRPVEGDLPSESGDMTKVMGLSYDLVLDGSEIGSGSMRNHDANVQRKVFTHSGHERGGHGEGVRLLPRGAWSSALRPTAASPWAWTGWAPSCWAARASAT